MRGVLLVGLLLGGCSHSVIPLETAAQPDIIQAPPVVDNSDPVACIKPSMIPPEPKQVGTKFNGDARHDLMILAPNAVELRAWGRQLRKLLENCAKLPDTAPR